jgi:hypothetical protein
MSAVDIWNFVRIYKSLQGDIINKYKPAIYSKTVILSPLVEKALGNFPDFPTFIIYLSSYPHPKYLLQTNSEHEQSFTSPTIQTLKRP